jgi:hypothetical protein
MGAFWAGQYGRVRSDEVLHCRRCEQGGVSAKERQWNFSLVEEDVADEYRDDYDRDDCNISGYCFSCFQDLMPDDAKECSICGEVATDLFEGWPFCTTHRPPFEERFYGPVGGGPRRTYA